MISKILRSGRVISFNSFMPTPITGKQEWVDKLPSYKQTRDRLCFKNLDSTISYCCLGVKCVLEGQTPMIPMTGHGYFYGDAQEYLGDCGLTKSGALPASVIYFDSTIQANRAAYSLATLNDNGFTFDEIAEIIDLMFVEKTN